MSATVQLPWWLAMLGFGISALWLLQHLLVPSARWFLRRRANRLIEQLNHRLALRIPGFKLTRRDVLVDRLSFDPRIIELVDRLAVERDLPREQLMGDVRDYAREIVPAFNALVYFNSAYRLARRLVHALYRVRLGYADDAALARLGPESSVVFLMNHRSNMDYILATYLAAERTALSYAVGEWARVWPLQQLIRAMGGYFVRRDSGDPLYRRVLECYVQMAAEGGVPQAVFLEGRLSRDGHLGAARLGLLGYMTRNFDPAGERDIVFIPVGINYDRVFEDRSLLHDAHKLPRRGLGFKLRTTVGFIAGTSWQALWGRRYRNGYACVNFGEPVSLKAWLGGQVDVRHGRQADGQDGGQDSGLDSGQDDGQRRRQHGGQHGGQDDIQDSGQDSGQDSRQFDRQGSGQLDGRQHSGLDGRRDSGREKLQTASSDVARLADDLMLRIGAITPILPVALVTRVITAEPARRFTPEELVTAVDATRRELESAGHRVYLPRGDVAYAVDVGRRLLVLRGLLEEHDGLVSANPAESDVLAYYANSIAHLPFAGNRHSRATDFDTVQQVVHADA